MLNFPQAAQSPRGRRRKRFSRRRRRTGRRSASGIGKRNTRLVRVRVLRKFGGDRTSRPGEAAVKRGDPRSQRQAGERSAAVALVGRGGTLRSRGEARRGPGRSRGALRSRREARGPPLSEAGGRAVGPGRSRGALRSRP